MVIFDSSMYFYPGTCTGSGETGSVDSPETGRGLRPLYLPPQSLSEESEDGWQDGGWVSGQAATAPAEKTENGGSFPYPLSHALASRLEKKIFEAAK